MSKSSKPVFISYARQASRKHAEALHLELGDELAFLDSEDIPFGDAFPERLVDALLDSRVVVILAEPVYFTRWYCLLEYRLARTPYLRLAERSGVGQHERDAALSGIVVAMPPGDADPMLERFPAAVQARNWAPVTEPTAVATLVRARLADGLPTLRERYEALGEFGTIHDIVLETTLLPGPGRIGQIPLVPVIGLPPSLHDRFVGRAKDIFRLHDVLTTERGGPSAAALTGAIEAGGGFGKTRLALEYLYRFGTRHFRGGLFWINAEQDVESQLYEVVKTLDPSASALEVVRTAQGGVAGALAQLVRSRADEAAPLFVIDNVPEPEAGKPPLPLSHWCPVLGEVAVLATSRRRLALGGAGSIVPVQIDTLEDAAAVRLLTSGARREELTEDEWPEIANWVGNLPLALDLLNGLLASSAMSARELLEMSRQHRPSVALDTVMDVLRGTVPEGTLRGVTQAFAESYGRLTEEEQFAARLLAWMAPAPVPDLLLQFLGRDSFAAGIRATLHGRHFVTRPASSGLRGAPVLFGSVHRVLADFLRARSPDMTKEVNHLADACLAVFAGRRGDDWLAVVSLHGAAITALITNALRASITDLNATLNLATTSEMWSLVNILFESGEYGWAKTCFEETVHWFATVLGAEHPATLNSMEGLAQTLSRMGDDLDAYALHKHVLDIRQRVLGDDDPDTLSTRNNLAATLWWLGDHKAAREHYEQILKRQSRVLGPEHDETLRTINNLAECLTELGDYSGSQQLHEQVLAIERRVFGDEDPRTLSSMVNLARTLWSRGEYANARAIEERVLTVRRRDLGIEHPDTTNCAWSLFITLCDLNELEEARRVFRDNIAWLLSRDPETLSAVHRRTREKCLQIPELFWTA